MRSDTYIYQKVRSLGLRVIMLLAMVAGMGGEAAIAQNFSYSTGFENPADDSVWTLLGTNQGNKWHIGTADHASGNRGLYISCDMGATNNTTSTAASVSYAYYGFTLTTTTACQVSFDWKCDGDRYNYYIRVFIAPQSDTLHAGIYPGTATNPTQFSQEPAPAGWIDISDGYQYWDMEWNNLFRSTEWQHWFKQLYVPLGSWNLVFVWCNSIGQSYGHGASIDNVSIVQPNCLMPSNLQLVGNMLTDSITVAWNNHAQGCNTWEVALGPWGNSADSCHNRTTVHDTFCTLTNLTNGIDYGVYVRSVCGNDPSLWLGPIRIIPGLHTMRTGRTDTITACLAAIFDDGGLNSNYSSNSSGTVIVRSPARDSLLEITGTYDISGTLRIYDGEGATISDALFDSHRSYNNTIGPILSNSNAVTIQFAAGNITLEGFEIFVRCRTAPDCHKPINLRAWPLSDSCMLTWIEPQRSLWCMEFGPRGFALGTGVHDTISDTSYLFTGLTPSTSYDCYMWAYCPGGTAFDTAKVTFTTHCTPLPRTSLPLWENFDTGTLPACWRFYYYRNNRVTLSNSYAGTYRQMSTSGFYSMQLQTNTTSSWSPVSESYAVLPKLDGTADSLELNFRFYNQPGTSNTVSVVTMKDPDDYTTYNVVRTIASDGSNMWSEEVVALNNLPAGHCFVALATTGYTHSVYIDDVILEPHNNCRRPQNLALAGTATTDSATVTWSCNDTNAAMWELVIVPVRTSPDSCAVIDTSFNTRHTFTNLPLGIFDIYVRSNCGTRNSNWYGPLTISTNMHIMRYRQWDTITTCGVLIADNCGTNGTYYGNSDDTLTMRLGAWDSIMYISGSYNIESCCDYLAIYEGESTRGTRIGVFRGGGTIGPLITTANAITLHFHSDAGGTASPGFSLYAGCTRPLECHAPARLTAEALVDSCTVRWSELGTSGNWELEYGPQGFTRGSNPVTMVADTTYTITGLNNNTVYDCYVWGYCQNGNTSDTALITFSTQPGRPVDTLPYRCSFGDSVMRTEWGRVNGSERNRWYIGTAANSGTANNYCLYISYNYGADYSYDGSVSSYVYAYRTFSLDTGDYICSFDWHGALNNPTQDFMRAALVPDGIPLRAGEACGFACQSLPRGAIALDGGSALMGQSPWQTHQEAFTVTTPGLYKLVFAWHNQGHFNQYENTAAIDNVSLAFNGCPPVTNLGTTSTATSIAASWTPAGSETSWAVEWTPESSCLACSTVRAVVNTPADTLAQLANGVQYLCQVRPICQAGDTGLAVATTATTLCDTIVVTAHGWGESFENFTTLPPCWAEDPFGTHWELDDMQYYNGQEHAPHDGLKALKLHACYGNWSDLVTPTLNLHDLIIPKLIFWQVRQPQAANHDELRIAVRSGDTGSWRVIATYSDECYTWRREAVSLPADSAVQVSFLGIGNGGLGVLLDDISIVDYIYVECDPPTGLTEQVTQTDALLTWEGDGIFEVTHKAAADTVWSDTVTTGLNAHNLVGLTPATAYQWRVRKVCESELISEWATSSFTTPQRESVDAATEGVSIAIHPNPTTPDEGVVVAVSGAEGPTTVTLIDVAGRILQRHTATATGRAVQLSLANIARGACYITVETPKGSATKKLIIN
ncbi:MAG: T9SS type A sorting domain-containing protein [Bacteroidales bacterium]|nr:T9SS type A sorting domain-containing protein [Bacteroidales bacterium]